MYNFLIAVIIFIGVISLVGTIIAGIQVNKTTKKIKEQKEQNKNTEALLKANYYKSNRSNVGILTIIYVIMFIGFILFIPIYLIVT